MRQLSFESGRLEFNFMDYISGILPILWKILEKKNCAINIATIDNELAVSIIGKRRIKRFRNVNSHALISDLTRYLQAC